MSGRDEASIFVVNNAIPWSAEATVVRMPLRLGGEPELAFEGSLAGAVRYLSELGRDAVSRYRVSLPNRTKQPRSYQGLPLLELVALATYRR